MNEHEVCLSIYIRIHITVSEESFLDFIKRPEWGQWHKKFKNPWCLRTWEGRRRRERKNGFPTARFCVGFKLLSFFLNGKILWQCITDVSLSYLHSSGSQLMSDKSYTQFYLGAVFPYVNTFRRTSKISRFHLLFLGYLHTLLSMSFLFLIDLFFVSYVFCCLTEI